MWLNPGRDIAHSFPDLLKRVLQVLDTPDFRGRAWFMRSGGTDESFQAIGAFLTQYVHRVLDLANVRTQQQALIEAGYNDLPDESKILLGWAMQTVIFAAYFHGYREMESGTPSAELRQYHIAVEHVGFFIRWRSYLTSEGLALVRYVKRLAGRDLTAPERRT